MDVVSVMRAAGNPDRLRILEVLRDSGRADATAMTSTDVARETELGRFSVSRDLTLLAEAELVHCVVEGRRRLHALCIETFETIEDWVIEFTLPPEGGAP